MTVKSRIFTNGNMSIAHEIIEIPTELRGSRNLLNKSQMDSLTGWQNNGLATIDMSDGFIRNTWTGTTSTPGIKYAPKISLPKGVYTLSVRANTDGLSRDRAWNFYFLNGVGPIVTASIPRKTGMDISTVTFTVSEPITDKDFYLLTVSPILGEFILYDWVKLEYGNKATTFQLSPEDLGYELPNWIQNFDNPVQFHQQGVAVKLLEEGLAMKLGSHGLRLNELMEGVMF